MPLKDKAWSDSHACLLKVHPSPAPPKCNLPFPTNPLPSIFREGFFPHQNTNSPQIFPNKFFFTSLFFIVFFFFSFISLILFQNLEFFPKVEELFPAFEANKRRIDTPACNSLQMKGQILYCWRAGVALAQKLMRSADFFFFFF